MRVFSVVIFLISILVSGCNDSKSTSADPNTGPKAAGAGKSLVCYVSTTMRASMEELARLHEARTGVKVGIEVADARALIAKIETSHEADLFVCHDPFLAMLVGKGIETRKAWAVASVKPMIAVPKGNPKKIGGLEDLARSGLRVGVTDANNSISGHIVTLMWQKAGIAEIRGTVGRQRDAVGQQLARFVPAVTGILEPDIGINAQGQSFFLVVKSVFQPPPFPTAWGEFQI